MGQAVYISSRLLKNILIQFFKLYSNLEQDILIFPASEDIFGRKAFLFFAFWLDKASNLAVIENSKQIPFLDS